MDFDGNGNIRHLPIETISFTPYNLKDGGFSQERPKTIFRLGQVLYVRDNFGWHIGTFDRQEGANLILTSKGNNIDRKVGAELYHELFDLNHVKAVQIENPFV